MQCFRIQVIGKVQGVYFRASTKSKADSLGLTGWVRNAIDGSVLIEAEGAKSNLDELIKWCNYGPTAASVERLLTEEIALQTFKDFRILF